MLKGSNAEINRDFTASASSADAARLRELEMNLFNEFTKALQEVDLTTRRWRQLIEMMQKELSEDEFNNNILPNIVRLSQIEILNRERKYKEALAIHDAKTAKRENANFNAVLQYLRECHGNPHPPRGKKEKIAQFFVGYDAKGNRKLLLAGKFKGGKSLGFSTILDLDNFELPHEMEVDPSRVSFFQSLKHKGAGRLIVSSTIWGGEQEPYKGAAMLHEMQRNNRVLNIVSYQSLLELFGGNSNNLLLDIILPLDGDLRRSRDSVLKLNGAEALTCGRPGVNFEYYSSYDHGLEHQGTKKLPCRSTLKLAIQSDLRKLRNGEDVVHECAGGKSRSVTHTICSTLELGFYLHEASELLRIKRPISGTGFGSRNIFQKGVMVTYFLERYTGLNLSINSREADFIRTMSAQQKADYLDERVERCQRQITRHPNPVMRPKFQQLHQDRVLCQNYRNAFLQMSPEHIANNLSLLVMLHPSSKKGKEEVEDLQIQHPEYYANMLINLNVFWCNLHNALSYEKKKQILSNLDEKAVVQLYGLLREAGVDKQLLSDFKNIVLANVVNTLQIECQNYLDELGATVSPDREAVNKLKGTLEAEGTDKKRLRAFQNEFRNNQITAKMQAKGILSRMAIVLKTIMEFISPQHVEFYESCVNPLKQVEKIKRIKASETGFFARSARRDEERLNLDMGSSFVVPQPV